MLYSLIHLPDGSPLGISYSKRRGRQLLGFLLQFCSCMTCLETPVMPQECRWKEHQVHSSPASTWSRSCLTASTPLARWGNAWSSPGMVTPAPHRFPKREVSPNTQSKPLKLSRTAASPSVTKLGIFQQCTHMVTCKPHSLPPSCPASTHEIYTLLFERQHLRLIHLRVFFRESSWTWDKPFCCWHCCQSLFIILRRAGLPANSTGSPSLPHQSIFY